MDSKPLLLVDVDNVLNVRPGSRRPLADWEVHTVQGPLGDEYTLHLNPEHGRWLTGLAELYELTWCTTWWRVANERIAPLVGLPTDLPAVPLPDTRLGVPLNFNAKTPHVRRYARGRALAWIDDDVDDRDAEALTRLKPNVRSHLAGRRCVSALVLNVDPDVGLTEGHIQRLRTWAELRRPGAMAQAALREERWLQMERTGGFLSDSDAASLSPSVRAGLMGVQRLAGMRYPAFQLMDAHDDTKVLPPAWNRLRELLAPAGWSDADLLLWAAAPNGYLEGRTPADEIRDHPVDVTEALRYAVTRAVPGFVHLVPSTSRALGDFLTLTHTAARLVERGRAAYDADEALRLAAETILRRISAAVARVDDGFVAANPSVHWRQMLRMRDVIDTRPGAEDYDAIWNTLETDLPLEAAEVRRVLRNPD